MFNRELNWTQVVGIDQGPEHVMTVWNWETEEESGKLLGKVATHQESFKIFYNLYKRLSREFCCGHVNSSF